MLSFSSSSFVATCLLLLSPLTAVNAQFDFGGGSGGSTTGTPVSSCSGSGTFQQPVAKEARLIVGDIPSGLEGLVIFMTSDNNKDIDIQLTSDDVTITTSDDEILATEVINWGGEIITEGIETTKTWNGDSITYSGYNGVADRKGDEFVVFNAMAGVGTLNSYRMYAYGYEAGMATVNYTWTGRLGCDPDAAGTTDIGGGNAPDPFGSGAFQQNIAEGAVIEVGELPAGLRDVYVRLDSLSDIDIQLYDGDIAVVNWQGGHIAGTFFDFTYPRPSQLSLLCSARLYSLGESNVLADGCLLVQLYYVLTCSFSFIHRRRIPTQGICGPSNPILWLQRRTTW